MCLYFLCVLWRGLCLINNKGTVAGTVALTFIVLHGGRNAFYLSNMHAGAETRVFGRVQSRNYNKDGIVKTDYEISINIVEMVSR